MNQPLLFCFDEHDMLYMLFEYSAGTLYVCNPFRVIPYELIEPLVVESGDWNKLV